jgi:hypothetical protein
MAIIALQKLESSSNATGLSLISCSSCIANSCPGV